MAKNLLGSRDVYNRYYGDFRGVDFSSDHTQVSDNRFAYLFNMYKDYGSGQGKAVETIAGYRRRVELPYETEIFGIHELSVGSSKKILIHAGERLILWKNYPKSAGVSVSGSVMLSDYEDVGNGLKRFSVILPDTVYSVIEITKSDGEAVTMNIESFDRETHMLSIIRSDLSSGDVLGITYTEGEIYEEDTLYTGMNARKSVSITFNNRLYIIDGKNYLVYDGERVSPVIDSAYVPTTYINIIPSGENADIGTEYEQRNVLQPKFKHTFIADGSTTEFYMNENELEEISEVKVYGSPITNYEADLKNGKVVFFEAPKRPEDITDGAYPEFYAGVEITAKKTFKSVSGVTGERENIYELITECTVAAVFDNRIFLSGNPAYPNHVFYCGRNLTGYVDPTYFGVSFYMQDGVGMAPITGMITVADTLMVLKSDTKQDGSVYFHTAAETGDDLLPKIYPSVRGLSGIGCLGACMNFLDDPIFISRLGVEAIGQLSVRYERAMEHRSSLIDAKLLNLDLSRAVLEEWNGYLLLMVDGKIFMADSRQRYTHETGVMQYEWYYLEDIGVYKDQYTEYKYSSMIYSELEGKTVGFCPKCKKGANDCSCSGREELLELPIKLANEVYDPELYEYKNITGTAANAPDINGDPTARIFRERLSIEVDGISYDVDVNYTVHEIIDDDGSTFYEAYLCDTRGNSTGGRFGAASVLKCLEENLFFGTQNGIICSFNFDLRDENGELAPKHYSFDGRTIYCGVATKMDSCDIPHLTKNTVKKSTVIKTKAFISSAAKIKVRTNRKPYEQIARINSSTFSFDNIDFSEFSFNTTEQSLFAVREKEKKWVEKQYYLYSDEYLKPFSLFYISFRYNIAGRYKE